MKSLREKRISLSVRRKARQAFDQWAKDIYDQAILQATGTMPPVERELVGESDWEPIEKTSLGPIIGRAKYELIKETRTWAVEDGKIIYFEPTSQIYHGKRTVTEYDM